MCFVEFMLLILSLGFSSGISVAISNANNNYYLMFLIIIFAPMLYVFLLSVYLCLVMLLTKIYKNKNAKYNHHFDRVISNVDTILLRLVHVKVIVKGKEKLPKKEVYQIVANHRSNFDPIVLLHVCPSPIVAVTKPETFGFPFAGNLIRACGYIAINRDDPREGAKAIFKARDFLKNNTTSVMIFPEGTRNKTDAPLLEMHAGSFKPAYTAKKKIVVASIKGTQDISLKFFGKNQIVTVEILDVLNPEDYASTVELEEKSTALTLDSITK